MSKFHWSTDRTAELGEHILTHSLDEARFAIYGDGEDFVNPEGAWKRLQDWWNSIPYDQRKYLRASGEINWWEIVDAVMRGQGQPRKYFSEFVDEPFTLSFRMNDGAPNHKYIWYDVSGEAGSYLYDTDTLKIVYRDVSSEDGEGVITSFEFAIPERTTVAYLKFANVEHVDNQLGIYRNRLTAEFLPHALLTLARMGISIVRWETYGSFARYIETAIMETGGRWTAVNKDRTDAKVIVWWNLLSNDSSLRAEKALWGAREANRTESGFYFSTYEFGRPYGETWAIMYQTGYDDTYSQVNMDYMARELQKLDPNGDFWQMEGYSGHGTGALLMVCVYDERGNLTEVYEQVREWVDYVHDHYPLLDEDEFFKREAAYIRENIKERIERIDDDADEHRCLLPDHPPIDELVDMVWSELSDNQWDTGNIDDFVLEEEQVLTALANLHLIDPQQFDEWDFCPIDYHGWSKWGDMRRRRRDYKPKRVLPKTWVGEAYPLLEWTVDGREPVKFEVVWTVGDVEGFVTTDEPSYRLTEPLPLHLGEDVWFSWKVRAILPDNVPTEWGQGWTYNMFQARTGKQSPDVA